MFLYRDPESKVEAAKGADNQEAVNVDAGEEGGKEQEEEGGDDEGGYGEGFN